MEYENARHVACVTSIPVLVFPDFGHAETEARAKNSTRQVVMGRVRKPPPAPLLFSLSLQVLRGQSTEKALRTGALIMQSTRRAKPLVTWSLLDTISIAGFAVSYDTLEFRYPGVIQTYLKTMNCYFKNSLISIKSIHFLKICQSLLYYVIYLTFHLLTSMLPRLS